MHSGQKNASDFLPEAPQPRNEKITLNATVQGKIGGKPESSHLVGFPAISSGSGRACVRLCVQHPTCMMV